MLRKLFIKILFISYLFLVAGIGLVISHFYFNHKAETGGGIPAETALTTIEGKVTEGRDVTLETKRRRGIDSKEQFYELDVQPSTGKMVKLRLDHSLNKQNLEQVLNENIVAKYDKTDENMTYDVKLNGQSIVAYQDMAKMIQEKANKQANFFGDGAMLNAGIWWIVIGAIGLFLRNTLQRTSKQITTEETQNQLD